MIATTYSTKCNQSTTEGRLVNASLTTQANQSNTCTESEVGTTLAPKANQSTHKTRTYTATDLTVNTEDTYRRHICPNFRRREPLQSQWCKKTLTPTYVSADAHDYCKNCASRWSVLVGDNQAHGSDIAMTTCASNRPLISRQMNPCTTGGKAPLLGVWVLLMETYELFLVSPRKD